MFHRFSIAQLSSIHHESLDISTSTIKDRGSGPAYIYLVKQHWYHSFMKPSTTFFPTKLNTYFPRFSWESLVLCISTSTSLIADRAAIATHSDCDSRTTHSVVTLLDSGRTSYAERVRVI